VNNPPSVITIAKECGVSPSTVCRALNQRPGISAATRARILGACTRLGYNKNTAASSLRSQESNAVVGIVADHGHEMHQDKLECLRDETLRAQLVWQGRFYGSTVEATALFREALSLRPAGIITTYAVPAELVQAAIRNQVAVVAYDQQHPQLDSVALDREAGFFAGTDYLLKTGCCQVLLLGADLDSVRGRGYARALAAHALMPEPRRIISTAFGRDLYHYGYSQIRALLGKVDFDAIVAVNDAAAIGAMRALAEAGLAVGVQVRVVGFDNIAVAAYVTPPLTTISQPKAKLAETALTLLQQRRQQPTAAVQTVVLPTELIVRNSA